MVQDGTQEFDFDQFGDLMIPGRDLVIIDDQVFDITGLNIPNFNSLVEQGILESYLNEIGVPSTDRAAFEAQLGDQQVDDPLEIDPLNESDPFSDVILSDAELSRQRELYEQTRDIEPTIPANQPGGRFDETTSESGDALFDEMQALLESQATDESGSGSDGGGGGGGNPIDEFGTNATNFEQLLEFFLKTHHYQYLYYLQNV